jgi:hypothetical protein
MYTTYRAIGVKSEVIRFLAVYLVMINGKPYPVRSLDPLNLENWYNGFSGLISVKNVRIKVECTSSEENGEEDTDREDALP